MAKSIATSLTLRVDGATDDQLTLGLLAALAVFDKAKATPLQAAEASFQRDGYVQYLGKDGVIADDWMTDEESRICHVWDEAEEAAVEACCAGWTTKPTRAYLELLERDAKRSRRAA